MGNHYSPTVRSLRCCALQRSTWRTLILVILALLSNSLVRADDKVTRSPAPVAEPGERQGTSEKISSREKEITNSIGMKLVLIRAGNFIMGSRESSREAPREQKPPHRVSISKPFYLGKFEVTRGEFRKFVKATNYRTEAELEDERKRSLPGKNGKAADEDREYTWLDPGFAQTDDHPVVRVTWTDSVAFCEWISRIEKRNYRLPTEAEWEWACRAGTIERWNTGDKVEDLEGSANIADHSYMTKGFGIEDPERDAAKWDDGAPFTAAVGRYKANQFGLHDMHGNVWEWCSDLWDEKYYANSPIKDPSGAQQGT